MKMINLLASIVLFSVFAYAQNNETSAENNAHILDEVVVKGKYAWIEGDKYVFVPRKNEKNLSRNMEDLIERMHTGILVVENGKIVTKSGQQASVFINGIPADNIDASTFWSKNTLRVEFMEFSDDPQFQGASNIVNFIMRDYVAGGLTKLDGNQLFPNEGNYSAASKLVWGKMTYNAVFSGSYSRDHQSGTDMTENYDNIYYNDNFYEDVTRLEHATEIKRSNNIYGGFNARYRTEKTLVQHSIALQWNENPGSINHGTVAYSPDIITSDWMTAKSKSHSLSPYIEGKYSFKPKTKWSFVANWSLSHSHNNNNNSYEDIGLNPIITLSKENIYNIKARINAIWNLSNYLVFNFIFQEDRSISKMGYGGEVKSNQWQNNGNNMLQISGWWRVSDKFILRVIPQITLYDWNVNHAIKKTKWLPGVNATAMWNINDKNRITLDNWFYQNSPSSASKNDLILRLTELIWIEGNPIANSSSNYWLTLKYNAYPCSWFDHSLSFDYITNSNEPYLSYRTGGKQYEGVIGQYQNSPMRHKYRGSWSFGIDLLDGNLRLGNQLEYSYQKINRTGFGWVRSRPYISWYFGNCDLSLNYGTPEKFFSQGGTHIVRTPSYYNLDFSYGNGNFMFDFELSAPFNKYLNTKTIFNSGPYHYSSKIWNTGRSVSISFTYTFDYGKKVEQGIEINKQNLKSTSILGSE